MENFTGQIEIARVRLEQMQQLVEEFPSPPPDLLEELFGQLSMALEELHVVTEELREQNQELLSTREQVEIERERYQTLFEEAPDPYLVTNAVGVIEEANKAAEQLFNLRHSFLRDKPLAGFVALPQRSAFRTQLGQLKTLKSLTEWEVEMHPRSGASFSSVISVSTIYDRQGSAIGFRWLIRNITELKEAEKNRQELVVEKELHLIKSRFIQILSQEFRTPLNTIHLGTQLLERYSEGVKHSKRTPVFDKIRLAIKQMTLILDDILIFNGDKDSYALQSSQLDLQQFCENLIEECKHLYNPGVREINFEISGEYGSVCINNKLLRHILCNVLANCFKFTPEGSQIDFLVDCEDDHAIFIFRDYGKGIPPEDIPHLFEIFYRARNVGEVPGSGLGLAIVKKSLDLLSGTIRVESTVGVGTTLTITLPTTPPPKSRPLKKRQSSTAQ